MIGVINYGAGNILSITNVLEELGEDFVVVNNSDQLKKVKKIIFPGVGAMPSAIESLNKNYLFEGLNEYVYKKAIPFMGICLGMQCIVTNSDEFNTKTKTFDWITGKTRILNSKEKKIKVPHIGWSKLNITKDHMIFYNIKSEAAFYFCHSYVVKRCDDVLATADHDTKFNAVIAKDNIIGVQFHPEKSGSSGLAIIENFLQFDG